MPYLPIDPKDIGREYDGDVIRINTETGEYNDRTATK